MIPILPTNFRKRRPAPALPDEKKLILIFAAPYLAVAAIVIVVIAILAIV
jgi:hypothetical protein